MLAKTTRLLLVGTLALGVALPAAARKVPTTDEEVGQVGGKIPGMPKVQLVKVADGFNDPISVTNAGDGSGRMFVVERVGRIKIVTKDGKVLKEPFLDLTKQNPIGGDVQSQFIEQGLYAVAFHPKFKQNGYFYVHYASLPFNGDGFVVRFKVSKDANKADPKSAKVIMRLERPYYNHNGGQIAFGPDGYLYISSGDGGWEGDVLNAGQSLDTLLGKMLRIDVDVDDRPYAVPDSNPFAKKPNLMELFGITEPEFAEINLNAKPEIWAYGIRNTWMFHFDPKNGDLFMAEVGQNHWEEINFQPAGSKGGENYGWARNMGTHCHPLQENNKTAKSGVDCNRVGVLPAAEYAHEQGCSVIGFGVAHNDEMMGAYMSGDWCSGRVWALAHDGRKWQFEEVIKTSLQFTGGGYDEDGNVLATHCNCFYTTDKGPLGNPPGALWKFVRADKVGATDVTAPVGAAAATGEKE